MNKTGRMTRTLAMLLTLVMLCALLPVGALAAAKAVPEKITLVGSDEALEYEYVDDLSYSFEDIPRYKVYVPKGTTQVSLHGTVYVNASAGSGYCSEDDLSPNNYFYNFEYWTADTVGSASPYTIETRMNGSKTQNMAFVKLKSYVGGSSDAYILQFEEREKLDAAGAPIITADLSTDALTLDYYGAKQTLSVTAMAPEGGTLSYQWQVSRTSASEGFEDIAGATEPSYSFFPSDGLLGDFWYRVVLTNTAEGLAPASTVSSAAPVKVTSSFMHQVTITHSKGRNGDMSIALKDAGGYANTPRKIDSTGTYTVTTYIVGGGDYTCEATGTVGGKEYKLGSVTIDVATDKLIQNFEMYLTYVYAANSSSWDESYFTTEVKDANGNVMQPGEPNKFASYMAYPYLLVPGSYTFSIIPSESSAAAGYQATSPVTQTVRATGSYNTWSGKMTQVVATAFTVAKNAQVKVYNAPSHPYGNETEITGTVDTSAADHDVYTFDLAAGITYSYRASGDGMVTSAGYFSASSQTAAFDLTTAMAGDPKAVTNAVDVDNADVRLGGVDHTGSVALAIGESAQLNPLRMWQIANNATVTQRTAYVLEPDFHYTVVDLTGSGAVSVDANGKITANGDGTALVLVTYDAMHVGSCGWGMNAGKTFSAIRPENTGVVVVKAGTAAAGGPSVNMTIGNGTKKVSRTSLDHEVDVLYYTGEGAKLTFTPETGSTVTLLRPAFESGAAVYAGGFSADGVSAGTDGSVTLTLTEGRNIVRVSKDGADSYQVVTAKKARAVITNVTHPEQTAMPGDTVTVTLEDVYHPLNWMAYLSNFNCRVSYTDPAKGEKVRGATSITRYDFGTADGIDCRTVSVTIPNDWDASKPYTLTGGVLEFYGNGKDIGSYRGDLTALSSAVPYLSANSAATIGALPDITIPVAAPESGSVKFSVKDDENESVDGVTVVVNNGEGDERTLTISDESTSVLPNGTWSYTASKEGYVPASGTFKVEGGDVIAACTLVKLTGIRVKTAPAKTEYVEGAKLDLTGLEVEGVTRSGAVTLDNALLTVTPSVLETVGEQEITVSFAPFTASFTVNVREENITVETTLTDGTTQKNSRMTFDVIARDENGVKIPVRDVKVTLNGSTVSHNWDDDTKTSYTLRFTQEGENTVTVTVRKKTLTYKVTYVKAEEGEVIGHAVFSIEAFSLGGGYIVEPCYVDIIEGENAAQALARTLKSHGFDYTNTGSLESGFYMASVVGEQLAEIDVTGDSIPGYLREKLEEKGISVSARSDATSLGEFDYTTASGWMYCHKNVFPNVGFADCYLSEGDVVRVQFTLAYGMDVGGGYAMGTGGSASYFALANKDALTRRMAEINAEIAKNADYLKDNGLTAAYDEAMTVLTTLNSTQEEVDDALAKLAVSSVAMGDVNGDGKVDNLDATVIYAYYNGKSELTSEQLKAADVNGDGVIDNTDAALVYAFYTGRITRFPA